MDANGGAGEPRKRGLLARFTAVALVASLLLPTTVFADARAEARRAFRSGMALIQAGELDQGVAKLEEAYDILPHPNVLFNIGRAYVDAERYEDAEEYLQRYIDSDPPDREQVEAVLAAVRERMGATSGETQVAAAGDTDSTAGGSETVAAANEAEIQAVEDSAVQIAALAEATQSEALRARAEHLRALAQSLRNGPQQAESDSSQGDGTTPADGAQDGAAGGTTTQGPSLGALALASNESEQGLYEESVVSASRLAQSPVLAPNATATITAQDIRLSGQTSIPELVRRTPGADVLQFSPSQSTISIRGLGRRNANKVLPLVDGRSVYMDFLGGTWWGVVPLATEDIERIEVIRGPASAVYGADAFSGIVNIITKRPGDGPSWLTMGAGTNNQIRVATGVTGREDRLSYRLGGGYQQADNSVKLIDENRTDYRAFLGDEAGNSLRRLWFNGELNYSFPGGYSASAGTAITTDGHVQVGGLSRIERVELDDIRYAQTFFSAKSPWGLSFNTYWNSLLVGRSGPSEINDAAVPIHIPPTGTDAVQAELDYSKEFEFLVPHQFSMGGNYRFRRLDEWLWARPGEKKLHFWGAYIQDVIQVTDPLRIQLSARADSQPLIDDVQFSPRGSVVYKLSDLSSIRGTVGVAFRTPTLLENYLYVTLPTAIRGVSGVGGGNEGLKPEQIISYELGYTNQESDYFAADANIYYNEVRDLMLFSNIDAHSLADYADGQNGDAAYDTRTEAFPVGILQVKNEDFVWRQYGGEVGLRVFPVRGVDAYVNYAYNKTEPVDKDAAGDRAVNQPSSEHKVNLGLQYRSPFGLDLAADFQYSSPQVWVEQQVDTTRGAYFASFDVDPLMLVNARIGYRMFDDMVEVGVSGTNLLMTEQRQHPFAQPMDTRYMGSATVRF